MAGDSSDAAKALGYSVNGVRIAATTAGGFIAGLGGASLSLYYPGSWNEGLSSGQGLIAVALVIFARWSPLRCLGAALLFGGAGAVLVGARAEQFPESAARLGGSCHRTTVRGPGGGLHDRRVHGESDIDVLIAGAYVLASVACGLAAILLAYRFTA